MRARNSTQTFARGLALSIFVAASVNLFISHHAKTAAQTVTLQTQPSARSAGDAHRAPSTSQRPPRARGTLNARDYSRFSHSTAAHAKVDCALCHHIPSFKQPDIADFPDHPACVGCHRQQFFRGARPAICADCHAQVSPRTSARFAFPKPGAPPEFADVFPHANHIKTTSLIQFKKVIGEKSNIQATCLYCHQPSRATTIQTTSVQAKAEANAPTSRQPDLQAANFAAPAGTYMTTPTSHTSCFQCHWQKGVADREQEPFATQCASCHRNTATAAPVPTRVSGANDVASVRRDALAVVATSRVVQSSFLTGRTEMPPRVAQKFIHEIDAHKKRVNDEGKEIAITCLQCHAAARSATTLEGLRQKTSNAGLLTCSSSACHTAVSGTAQLTLSVYRELRERAKDVRFACVLCHTPPQSLAADVPCTHYAAVFTSATKEKKSTKGVEQLTPPRCAEELKRAGQ